MFSVAFWCCWHRSLQVLLTCIVNDFKLFLVVFADACVYKGRTYARGQRWQDGCDYNCVCENEMTGEYKCTERYCYVRVRLYRWFSLIVVQLTEGKNSGQCMFITTGNKSETERGTERSCRIDKQGSWGCWLRLMEFLYLVFTRMPGESYSRRLRSLLYLCYVFRALINSLVCWFIWTGF